MMDIEIVLSFEVGSERFNRVKVIQLYPLRKEVVFFLH